MAPIRSPLRAVFVVPDFAAGGAQRVSVTLANRLADHDCGTVIVALSDDGPLAATVAADVPVVALGHRRLRQALPDLARALRDLRPDAVFSTLGYMNLGVLGMRWRLPARTRVVVREANTPSRSLPRLARPRVMRLAYRLLYRRADAVIAPSQAIAAELIRELSVPARRTHVVPNPVDEERLRAAADPPRRHPGPGPRFVAAGRLTEQKGFDRLLPVLAALADDVHVTIVGDGPEAPALRASAERLGIAHRVHFAGFDPAPWPRFAGADALLLPSRWEGMPNVALEALACGTPVIATPEAGGIAELAEAAPAGAVTVVPDGRPFGAVMAAVAPTPTGRPRPSLLPGAFALDAVAARVRALLSG